MLWDAGPELVVPVDAHAESAAKVTQIDARMQRKVSRFRRAR